LLPLRLLISMDGLNARKAFFRMYFIETIRLASIDVKFSFWQLALLILTISLCFFTLQAQNSNLVNNEKNELVIDEIKDAEVFSFGKTVVIKKEVKGVLVFGGDIVIEGRVEGDVATIGGSIIQKENAFIGGDVIIFGGKYYHERAEPYRNPDKETIMYAGYEEELRNLTQNPTQIFSPQLTWSFIAWRLLSVLFWFIVSLLFTTVAPGAISRAVARLQLSSIKVVGVGLLIFILSTLSVIVSLSFLPSNFSGVYSLMVFVLLSLSYFFGRVALQVSFGKWLQKRFLPERFNSESIALLIGSLVLVILLSIPYFWALAVVLLFSTSLGLVFTARSNKGWNGV
jgi:hypothetical protein